MFEELGLEGWTALEASVVFGLLLGGAFGVLAQRSRFCLRRAVVGEPSERHSAAATWLSALAIAVAGTTYAVHAGLVDFAQHRFHGSEVPVLAIIIGGLMFGAGMVLTRGCASRLSVLAATGNLRAVVALGVFAIAGHATMKGVLAPARVELANIGSVDFGAPATLASLVGDPILAGGLLAAVLIAIAASLRGSISNYAFGAAIGALVPLGWIGTGYVLLDEFDPIAMESLAFTSTMGDTLFWLIAGTAVAPGFGAGLIGGVLLGSFAASTVFGDFKVVGFSSSTPVGRYLGGAALMGFGGVLAGGCTVGAGLSGVATLSLSAALALVAITAGALLADGLAKRGAVAMGGGLVPAE